MLIAQAIAPPNLPGWEWWATWGPLGILAFAALAAGAAHFFAVWLPHQIAKNKQERLHEADKQKLLVSREEKLNTFIDRLSATHGEELEHKRMMATTLDRMDRRQDAHAQSCDETHKLVKEIHQRQQLGGAH